MRNRRVFRGAVLSPHHNSNKFDIHISINIMSSNSTLIPVWVKVVCAGSESITFIDCDPAVTNIARLKELVKEKHPRKLEHVDAPDLVVKSDEGERIKEDALISDIVDEHKISNALIVEVPAGVFAYDFYCRLARYVILFFNIYM